MEINHHNRGHKKDPVSDFLKQISETQSTQTGFEESDSFDDVLKKLISPDAANAHSTQTKLNEASNLRDQINASTLLSSEDKKSAFSLIDKIDSIVNNPSYNGLALAAQSNTLTPDQLATINALENARHSLKGYSRKAGLEK